MTGARRDDTAAGDHLKRFGLDACDSMFFRVAANRLAQRVFAAPLQHVRDFQQPAFFHAFGRSDGYDLDLTGRQCSRFIENYRVHTPQQFQRLGGFDQDAVFRRAPCCDHDRDRCRQSQRAGA